MVLTCVPDSDVVCFTGDSGMLRNRKGWVGGDFVGSLFRPCVAYISPIRGFGRGCGVWCSHLLFVFLACGVGRLCFVGGFCGVSFSLLRCSPLLSYFFLFLR